MRQTKITAFIETLKDDEPTELDLLELIELCENTIVRRVDVEATTGLLLKLSKGISEKVVFDLTSKLVASFPFVPKLIVETTFYGDLHAAIYKVDFSYYIQKFFERYFNDKVLVKRHDGIFCEKLDLLIVNQINHITDPRDGVHSEILCHVNYALDCLLNVTTFNLRRGLPVDKLLELTENKLFSSLSDMHLKTRRNWFIDRQTLVSTLLPVDQQQIKKPTTTKPKLILGLVIWGHAVEQAQQSCIPTFFHKRNWAVLSNVFDANLHVIALTADAAKLELHNALNLPKNVDVKYHYLSSDIVQQSASMEGFNYHLSSLGHNILVKISTNLNSSLVLLTPDAIYSKNVANEICKSFNKDKMLFCQCPRTIYRDNLCGRNFDDQEMAEALKKRLHSSNFAYSDQKNTVSGLPGIFVSAEHKKYVVRTFHPHPLLIPHDFLMKKNMQWFESIDGDFAAHLYIAAGGTTDNFENLVELHRELDKPVMIDLTHEHQHNNHNETEIDEALSQEEVKNFTRRLGLFHRLAFDRPGYISDALEEEVETNANKNLQALRKFVNQNANADSWPSVTDIPTERKMALVRDNSLDSNTKIKKTVLMCAFVWGDEYIDNFLTVCLPTLLGSIEMAHNQFKNEICCRFTIGVPSSQIVKFNQIQRKLDSYTPAKIEVVELESISSQNEFETKYQTLTNLQISCLQKYKNADYMCFVYSDFVWSLNAISALYAQIKAGATAVFQFIPQVNKDKFLVEFISEIKANGYQRSPNDFGVRISEDRLVGLARRNLHYLVTSSIHNRHTFNPVGPYYFLADDQNNLVVRAFHLHPTIFKIPERVVAVDSSFDEKFITSNFSIADCQVITTSDQACICSLERETLPRGKGSKEKLGHHQNWQAWFIDWFLTKADPQHWFLFQHEIMFGRYQNNALLLEHRKRSSNWLNGLLFQLAMLQSNHSNGTPVEGKTTKLAPSFLARCFFRLCVLFEPIFSANLRSLILESMPVSLRAKLTSYKGKRNG